MLDLTFSFPSMRPPNNKDMEQQYFDCPVCKGSGLFNKRLCCNCGGIGCIDNNNFINENYTDIKIKGLERDSKKIITKIRKKNYEE